MKEKKCQKCKKVIKDRPAFFNKKMLCQLCFDSLRNNPGKRSIAIYWKKWMKIGEVQRRIN